jgi:hypothetical protein
MEAASNISSAQADFDLTVSFDVVHAKIPNDAAQFLDQPLTINGHMAAASDPQALDLSVNSTMAGQDQKLALKTIAGKVYVGLNDHWYATPPELQQMLGGDGSQSSRAEDLWKTFDQLGLDPVTWMTDVRAVGNETIDGMSVHHLQARPDLAKMMADLVKLSKSPEFSRLLGQASPGPQGAGLEQATAALQGLEGMQQTLTQMFRALTMDLWVDTDSLRPVKMAVNAEIQPPAGQDSGGINSIKIALNLLLTHINETIKVDPPVAPESWEAFQKALMDNPSLFGPLGALGDAGALGSDITGTIVR